jgi:hypothetical protein
MLIYSFAKVITMGYGSEARNHLAGNKTESEVGKFIRSIWKQTDVTDSANVERSTRIGQAAGYEDCDSAFGNTNTTFTSDSGTDKGGNDQNWFKD